MTAFPMDTVYRTYKAREEILCGEWVRVESTDFHGDFLWVLPVDIINIPDELRWLVVGVAAESVGAGDEVQVVVQGVFDPVEK